MPSSLKFIRRLQRLTTAELKQLWVEAFKSWMTHPQCEPPDIVHVETELDARNEGLPFPLVRAELAISLLRAEQKNSKV